MSSNHPSPLEIWRRAYSSEVFSKPASQNGIFSRLISPKFNAHSPQLNSFNRNCSYGNFVSGFLNSRHMSSGIAIKLPSLSPGIKGLGRINKNELKHRFFSVKGFNSVKFNGNFGKSVVDKTLSAVTSAFSRYREAAGLQVEAFWKRNYLVLVGAGAVVVCIALWRIMFGVASSIVGLSEGMAKYGLLALATAMVAFVGMYLRSRFTINPDKIYRMAMRKLNTSAGILEVMGAPLTGTDVRAYVMSGGGPKLKNFKLKFGDKRCFLIFPIKGSERRGLVSVEVKKKKGQYDMKLLAVDIPMAAGPDQRLFLIGDKQEYQVGGGLISELRDPIVKAMAAEKEFEDLDQQEEEEDAIREQEEAERRQHKEKERALEEEERERREAEMVEEGSSWK
ncbi:Molybdenum cofactor biosynthesis protein 1 [Cocos nucifera]|uniref:Molybdenum cofactor biosynthesis protein 1 n=1 Tax=Cocos nucifera TaxID=13894 RepID=A0A8K0NFZ8_COCNU|nr:Molybdenum cofactor biosynthesis protein 1 [Cocos nucifera]